MLGQHWQPCCPDMLLEWQTSAYAELCKAVMHSLTYPTLCNNPPAGDAAYRAGPPPGDLQISQEAKTTQGFLDVHAI
jgi:hypothetical protein